MTEGKSLIHTTFTERRHVPAQNSPGGSSCSRRTRIK